MTTRRRIAAEVDKQAEADKMVVIGCCSTGSASGGHRAGTPPLLEPALQQSIKTILSVSAYLSASAASLVQGRWIYHKSTGPRGERSGRSDGRTVGRSDGRTAGFCGDIRVVDISAW